MCSADTSTTRLGAYMDCAWICTGELSLAQTAGRTHPTSASCSARSRSISQAFEKDDDGFITPEELKVGLTELGKRSDIVSRWDLSHDEIDELEG